MSATSSPAAQPDGEIGRQRLLSQLTVPAREQTDEAAAALRAAGRELPVLPHAHILINSCNPGSVATADPDHEGAPLEVVLDITRHLATLLGSLSVVVVRSRRDTAGLQGSNSVSPSPATTHRCLAAYLPTIKLSELL